MFAVPTAVVTMRTSASLSALKWWNWEVQMMIWSSLVGGTFLMSHGRNGFFLVSSGNLNIPMRRSFAVNMTLKLWNLSRRHRKTLYGRQLPGFLGAGRVPADCPLPLQPRYLESNDRTSLSGQKGVTKRPKARGNRCARNWLRPSVQSEDSPLRNGR